MKQANDLISVLKEANQAINPQLYDIADMGRGNGRMRNRNRGGIVPRNDMRGGRRDDSRSGRMQGRDNYGPRNDRMRGDDRNRVNARPDRNAASERGGYSRDNQSSGYGRDSNYNRDGQAGFGRDNQSNNYGRDNQSAGFNRENQTAGYNRENQASGYNRDSQQYNSSGPGRTGLLSTPQGNYQHEDHGHNDSNRYSGNRPQAAAPRGNQRSEGNAPPHQRMQGPPVNHNVNNQYMNGPSRGHPPQMNGSERHGARGSQQEVHHGGPPGQHYDAHNMPVSGPHRGQQMNGPHRGGGPQINGPASHHSGQNMPISGPSRAAQAMSNAQTMQSLFQPPPPPPPIPNSGTAPSGKSSLMGPPPPPPPPINGYYA